MMDKNNTTSKEIDAIFEKVKEIMNKDPKQVSDAEYAALLIMYDSFSTVDENGNNVLDNDAFNKFIEASYIFDATNTAVAFDFSSCTTFKYKISPVCQSLNALYASYIDREIGPNVGVFYDNDDSNRNIGSFLSTQVVKAVALNEVCTNMVNIETTTNGNLPFNPMVSLKLVDKNSKKYEISTSWYVDGYYGRKVSSYGFNKNNLGSFCKKIKNIASNMKKDEWVEQINKFIGTRETKIINKAWGLGEKVVGKNIITIAKDGYNAYKTHVDVESFNGKLDNLINVVDLEAYLDALYVGCSISSYQSAVTVNYAYIDQNSLQIALYAYEYNTKQNLSLDDVMKSVNDKNSGVSSEITDYMEWKIHNDQYLGEYERKLNNALDDYKVSHPNFDKKKRLKDLSLDELNEINSLI